MAENTQKITENRGKKLENSNNKLKKQNKAFKGAVIGLAITAGVLGLSSGALGIALAVDMHEKEGYTTQLENIYEKNYYELIDNVNTIDTEMSKVLTTNDSAYQAKLLTDVSNISKNMQNNISNLPITGENIAENVKFINQLSGYTEILEERLKKGEKLTEEELGTLNELHITLAEMKDNLNAIAESMRYGYSILEASKKMNGDMNNFSIEFDKIKSVDVSYPTMIYDGPFSDSVVDKKVVGISGKEISKEDAADMLKTYFKDAKIKYVGDTVGNFVTYNFEVESNGVGFVQVTKIGGHVLTISGNKESESKKISLKDGEKIATNFVEKNGIKGVSVVWSDVLKNQAYYNIAPVIDGIIIYPDLIKVKVDLENGDVVGYDAMSYYTNHKERTLVKPEKINAEIPSEFSVKKSRLVLAPLDYNREVLCYEYECTKENDTYYFYFNAYSGQQENILKVVQTEDGSKLM